MKELVKSGIFFAVLCGNSTIHRNAVYGLIDVCTTLAGQSIPVGVELFTSSKPIQYIRSELSNMFMHLSTHEWILFIDDDVGFSAKDVFCLLKVAEPLVVGGYPYRTKNPENVFVLDIKRDPDRNITWNTKNTAIEVNSGGTGFMLINRSVFLDIAEKYPELNYVINYRKDLAEKKCFNYFDTIIENSIPLGEDVSFCRRYAACNKKIWAAVDVSLSHSGMQTVVSEKSLREMF